MLEVLVPEGLGHECLHQKALGQNPSLGPGYIGVVMDVQVRDPADRQKEAFVVKEDSDSAPAVMDLLCWKLCFPQLRRNLVPRVIPEVLVTHLPVQVHLPFTAIGDHSQSGPPKSGERAAIAAQWRPAGNVAAPFHCPLFLSWLRNAWTAQSVKASLALKMW